MTAARAPRLTAMPTAADLLAPALAHMETFVRDLADLVAIDSGSYSPHGVNRVADRVRDSLTRLGFTAERVPLGRAETGDAVLARKPGRLPPEAGGRRVLLLGHLDTVFEDGTAAARPFRTAGRLAHGPGVCDDKGGLLAGLTALRLLAGAGWEDYAEVLFLAVPDEEIGGPASRALTEATAREADVALVLECARENGDLVVARKGVSDFRIRVTGRAAHAGIEPGRGASAALAAAHLVVALQALNGRWQGVTVNVGVVRAGTRSNIVCPDAELRLEVRAATRDGLRRATDAVRELGQRRLVPGTSAAVHQIDVCPPMEATHASRTLLAEAQGLAADLGLRFDGVHTGGVGDANLVAGTGTPVLDGLGPVGGADHSPDEWLDLDSVPQRVALLAALTARVGDRRDARSTA